MKALKKILSAVVTASVLLAPLSAFAGSGGGVNNGTGGIPSNSFINWNATTNTLSTSASTTAQLTGPLMPDRLLQKAAPSQTDDVLRNNAPGNMWVQPDGTLWINQRNLVSNAWWAQGLGSLGGNIGTTSAMIRMTCDIAATTYCYGLRALKNGYVGKLVQLTRLSDGTTFDIYVATTTMSAIGQYIGGFDWGTFNLKCANTVCRVAKWYNQDGSGNDATPVYAPVVVTTTGSNTVASAGSIQVNNHIESVGGLCKVDTYVTATTSTTFTTNNGCTVASGINVMFSNAPIITAQNKIGNSPAMVFDSQTEWNATNSLNLPSAATVTANAMGVVTSLRVEASVRGNAPFQLGTSTGAYVALNNGNGFSGLGISPDGSSTGVRYGNNMGFETPYVATVPSGANAVTVEETKINTNSIGTGSLGAVTMKGGTLGSQSGTGLSGWFGDVEMGDFVVYSVAMTETQLVEARASEYVSLGLQPQNRQFGISMYPDSLLQGPENSYLLNTARQLSDLIYPYGGRVVNNGWTSRQLSQFDSTTILGSVLPQYKQNFIVAYPSYNNYGGIADCGTYWTTGVLPFMATATSTGATLVMLTTQPANFTATEQQWMASCNAKVIASSTAMGYSYVDIAGDPALSGSAYTQQYIAWDQVHPTNLASGLIAQKIMTGILPLLRP